MAHSRLGRYGARRRTSRLALVVGAVASLLASTVSANAQAPAQSDAAAASTAAVVPLAPEFQTPMAPGVDASAVMTPTGQPLDPRFTTGTSSAPAGTPPPTSPTFTVTETVDRAGAPPIYPRGGQVTYTTVIQNTLAAPDVIAISDPLPLTLLTQGAPYTINGSTTCPTGATCSFAGQSLSVTNLTLPAYVSGVSAGTATIVFSVIALGLDRQCSNVQDALLVSDAVESHVPSMIPTITVCDSGLGLESWWTDVSRAAGPQATAAVNVANGNLVVQQKDFTPIQIHGHLGLGLTRTYNSEDSTLLTLPGSIGAGWTFNISEAGDLAGDGHGVDALSVPSLESLLNPLAVTLIDQDGTRHVYQPSALSAVVDVTGLATPGALAPLVPATLSVVTGHRECVDESFTAPAGVHMSMWRYIDSPTGSCGSLSTSGGTVLGFVIERPDRLRYELNALGQLVDIRDGAGNEIKYTYNLLNEISQIMEPVTGRAFSFTYPTGQNEVDITDPAGRWARYLLDGAPLTAHLTEVKTYAKDMTTLLSDVVYTYGSCMGSASNQLCSARDPNGHATTLTYTSTTSDSQTLLGLPHVASLTDRNGNQTTFSYTMSPDALTVTEGTEQSVYETIDTTGRVGEMTAGDTSSHVLHETLNTWDASGSTCRQPDNKVDNNLCTSVQKSFSTSTPDMHTAYLYNPEGKTLSQSVTDTPTNVNTTWGYHAQYAEASGAVNCFNDSVQGSDTVTSAATTSPAPCASGSRGDTGTLFYLSDQTQALTPRGNNAGSGYAAYTTTTLVDDNATYGANVHPATTPVCATPSAPTSNTGSTCETDAPVYDGTHPIVTRYTYDVNGQKASMTTPNTVANGGGTPITYTYYPDYPPVGHGDTTQTQDLSGTTASGGWLKATTDPYSYLTVFAYDAAGNVAWTWDRNATAAVHVPLSAYPGSLSGSPPPPSTVYTQTLHGSGSGSAPYAQPWRYLLSSQDQVGDLTRYTVDSNGNRTATRTPRGTVLGNAADDITQAFDANDNLVCQVMPAEANGVTCHDYVLSPTMYTSTHPTTYGFNVNNDNNVETNPDGMVSTFQYDSVNRLTQTTWTRAVWPSDLTQVPPSCRESTSADLPIPAGRILCTTSHAYDGVDNTVSSTDGNGQTSTFTFDGARRQISQLVPRTGSVTERTDTLYDADGHLTDTCLPREFSEGPGSCTSTAHYSTHVTYDVAGRKASTTTYRSGTAHTATMTYDPDGNMVSQTDPDGNTTTWSYGLNDTKHSMNVPRASGSSYQTIWNTDPSLDYTQEIQPSSFLTSGSTGTGADGALTVDGATYPQAHPYVLTSTTKNFTTVTLQNGGWLSAPAWNGSSGGVVQFLATGTVTVCSTCGITVAGLGAPGAAPASAGSAGSSGSGSGPGGGGATSGGGGGGAGHALVGTAGGAGGGSGGTGGATYGASDLSDATGLTALGSGGGGGAGTAASGGGGGAGGGFVHITAKMVADSGAIVADGAPGGSSSSGGGGGGGSAGAIWLTGLTVTIDNPNGASTAGGAGGAGSSSGNGGAGAEGRFRVDAVTFAGAASGPSGGSTWGSQDHTWLGRVTAWSYDAAHRLVDTVAGADNGSAALAGLPDSSGGKNIRTHLAYDPDGHVVATFEPRAFLASTTTPDALFMVRTDYDADGRPIAQYVPRYDNSDDAGAYSDMGLGSTYGTQSAQCPTGASPQPVAGVPGYPSGAGVCITKAVYDAANNRTQVTLPTSTGSDNRYVGQVFTDDNLVATVTAPSPASSGSRVNAATNIYDADGKLVKQTDANTNQQTTAYTRDELKLTVTAQPNGSITHITRYGYDGNGNPTTVTDPAGNQSVTAYYTDNTKQSVHDAAGDRTTYTDDATGNPIAVLSPSGYAADSTDPLGTATVNTYTADNLLLSSTVPVKTDGTTFRKTTYTYDDGGRKTSQHVQMVTASGGQLQDGLTQSFTYYNDDRLSTETGRNGETISTKYDPAGNTLTTADSTSATTITATYYADDRARSVHDGLRTTQSLYDGAGSPTASVDGVDGGATYATTYAYDDAELPSQMVSDGVHTTSPTTWTYDAGGRPVGEVDPNGQAATRVFNADNTLASQTLTSGSTTIAAWTYTYDQDYRQTQQAFSGQSVSGGGGAVTATFQDTYDSANRLKTWVNGSTTTTYSWDHDSNRTQVAVGGGTTTTYTYSADDTLLTSSAPATTDTYVAFGGVLSDGCFTYSYDGFDRMTAATPVSSPPAGCLAGTVTATYTHDGRDRQISHTDGSVTTALHYQGLSTSVNMETAASGTNTVYELAPSGAPKGFTVENGASPPPTEFLTDDGQGNVTTTTDPSAAVRCTARFDPFGSPLGVTPGATCSSGTTVNDFFYRAARHDTTTGDYQFGSRTYDPTKASFLAPDSYRNGPSQQNLSVGVDPMTRNTYSYVNGDPVNLSDPTGHRACGDQACYAYQFKPGGAIDGQAGEVRAEDTSFRRSQFMDQYLRQRWTAQLASAREWAREDLSQLHGCGQIAGNPCSAEVWRNDAVAGACDLLKCIGDFLANHKLDALLTVATLAIQEIPGLDAAADAALTAHYASEGGEVVGALDEATQLAARASEESSSALDDAANCAINSFSAGTLVVMADGTTKAISRVKLGDKVEATDPATGQMVVATVSHLFLNDDRNLVDILVRQGRRTTATLHATQGHPFWDVTTKSWTLAANLKAGDQLLSDDGSLVTVAGLTSWTGSQWMWDLTVDNLHDFFVVAGDASVLVHNCNEPGMPNLHEHFGSQEEAGQAAMSDAGINPDTAISVDNYSGGSQMLGRNGEPWQQIVGETDSGDVAEIQLHNAHSFPDGGGFGPHYINPTTGMHYFW